jgi:hypothetical protein
MLSALLPSVRSSPNQLRALNPADSSVISTEKWPSEYGLGRWALRKCLLQNEGEKFEALEAPRASLQALRMTRMSDFSATTE